MANCGNISMGYLDVRIMSQDMTSCVGIFLFYRNNSCEHMVLAHFLKIGGDSHGLNSQMIA